MNTGLIKVASIYASADTQFGIGHGLVASTDVRTSLQITTRGVSRFPGAHYDGLSLNRHPLGVGVVARGIPHGQVATGVIGVTLTEMGQGQVFTNLIINQKLQIGHEISGVLCLHIALAVVSVTADGKLSVGVFERPHPAADLDSFLAASQEKLASLESA